MRSRDKSKGKHPEADPAMVEIQGRLSNSLVEFNQTDRNKTVVRANELDGVCVRQNLVKEGGSTEPGSGRSLFNLGSGAQRVTIDRVNFRGSGFDSFVSGANAQYLAMTGCSMETGGARPAEPRHTKSRRTIFLPPRVSLVPSREEQFRTGNLVGRNDPCPCGAAKKYKHCHGKIA